MSQDFLAVLNVRAMASSEKKEKEIGAGEGGPSRTVIFRLPYFLPQTQ